MLGDTLDTENVTASYHAGVLRLEIPVAEAAKPRKITVESIEQKTPDTAKNGQNAVTPASEQSAVTA
jgi:HSP20 family protein